MPIIAEANSEPISQASKIELFAEIVNGLQLFSIFLKNAILDSEYASITVLVFVALVVFGISGVLLNI